MALRVTEVPVDRIVTEEAHRVRREGLERSMKRFGLLVAIDLCERPGGTYDLEDGRQRLAVARRLGWKTIRAVVAPAGEAVASRDLKAIIVNTQRQNLRQLDIARHARRLIREGGYSQAELARQIDMSKSHLCRMLKVIECPELESAIQDDGLEYGAAKAIAVLNAVQRRQVLAELSRRRERDGKFPSVRQVEEIVALRRGATPLPEVPLEDLVPIVGALRLQDFPAEIQVTRGKQSQLKVTLVLAEEDQEWVTACLAGAEG
jgi:ParB/RepB/Spo0J family partition protein